MQKNRYIDHTILKPEATKEQILELCQEALKYNFASVCINPTWVALAAKQLKFSDVRVCTVIGFPLGANTTAAKVFETKDAKENGAQEIDMVINIGALLSNDENLVYNDIKEVVDAASPSVVKVIIETSLLNDEQKVKACELAMKANAAFVKTSTGFSTGGATVEDVALMKSVVKNNLEVKASGGVKTKEDFEKMVEAGATRIGTSNGVNLI